MDNPELPLISLVVISSDPLFWQKHISDKLFCALANFNFEILVVQSSGQNLPTKAIENLNKFNPRCKFFIPESSGPGQARQYGISKASGSSLILLDEDCFLDLKILNEIIFQIQKNESTLMGGRYVLQPPASYWAHVYSETQQIWLEHGPIDEARTEHLLGGCLFMQKSVAEKIYFDSKVGWGGEEKIMIQHLWSTHQIPARLIDSIGLKHIDNSGFYKFFRRAFFQGFAATKYQLSSQKKYHLLLRTRKFFWPGLFLFFCISHLGRTLGFINRWSTK